jgi:hypothetical protein
VTQLGGGRALVWGGHMEAQPVDMGPLAGELLTGLNGNGTPASGPIGFTGVGPIARAVHHAVQLGPVGGDILIVGGFDITNGTARTTAARLAERLTMVSPQGGIDVTPVGIAGGGAPTPAGYLGVTRLRSGDVLISGGNPQIGYGVCNQAQDGIMCSLADSYVYRAGADALQPTGTPLMRSRYGHADVQMQTGQVLVTGGLYAPAPTAALELVRTVEVLDPRRSDLDALAPGLTRAPGGLAGGADGSPRAACEIIETAAPAQ